MPGHDFNFTNAYQPQGVLDFSSTENFTGRPPNPYGLPDFGLNIPSADNNFGFQAPTQGLPDMFSVEGAFGKGGWAPKVGQTAAGLFGAYTGINQLKLGQDIFDFQKGITETNLANQAQTINTQLSDQYSGRYSAGSPQASGIDDYLAKNRVSGTRVGG